MSTTRVQFARLIFVDSLNAFPWKLIETSEIITKIKEAPLYIEAKGLATITVQINLHRTQESPDGWPYRAIDLSPRKPTPR
jgi:hypothetical protein